MSTPKLVLPLDSAERKRIPIASGCLDYFPAALAEVALVSFVGNEKHNPGEPLHHARDKSGDHADAMQRHFLDRGQIDTVKLPDGRVFHLRVTAEMAWRALALLQEELEQAGLAPLARGARFSAEGEPLAQVADRLRIPGECVHGVPFDVTCPACTGEVTIKEAA